jgi:hypothetical protein
MPPTIIGVVGGYFARNAARAARSNRARPVAGCGGKVPMGPAAVPRPATRARAVVGALPARTAARSRSLLRDASHHADLLAARC